jgi:hypothetical protein
MGEYFFIELKCANLAYCLELATQITAIISSVGRAMHCNVRSIVLATRIAQH